MPHLNPSVNPLLIQNAITKKSFQTYKVMKVSLWRAMLANREIQDKKRAAAQQNKAG